MSIQDTFNRVIDAGYYGVGPGSRTPYMCHALSYAANDSVISYGEAWLARAEIERELAISGSLTMSTHLFRIAKDYYRQAPMSDYKDKDFTALYRDWDNRPKSVEVHLNATFN